MKLKREKNQWGWYRIECPFCGKSCASKDKAPLQGIQNHILLESKKEAFSKEIDDAAMGTKHLDYFKEHTKPETIIKINKRAYDNDLKVND